MAIEDTTEAKSLKRIQEFHQQTILIVGFIGGIVFAGFVLVLGNPDFILNGNVNGFIGGGNPQLYLRFVASYLAFESGMCVIVVVESLLALTLPFQSIKGHLRFWKYVDWGVGVVFSTFIAGLPVLLWPLMQDWSFVPIIPLIVVFGLYSNALRNSRFVS